ncbi:MAG: hypothetical protein QXV17_06715, partial [Candidatus Micrarchaeaceae archaeon]
SGVVANPINVIWFYMRAYPPNGVMPSVSFGAVQTAAPTLTITPNPAVYGQSITITATCPASSDSCAIDYPNLTTTLASGTGSATYTYPAFSIAAGTYAKYYAVDKTSSLNSTAQTLTINKNSTYALTLSNCTTGALPYTCSTTATIATHNNQLIASLYLNNNLVGSTNTIITSTIANQIGTFAYTFNTLGNTNYTSKSLSVSFSKLVPLTFYNITAAGTLATNPITAAITALSTYYPYKLFAPSYNGITYTLNQTINGKTTTLVANSSTMSYIPPDNQLSGCLNLAAGTCNGTVTYTQATTLTGNVIALQNIIINPGVTITTNGYSFVAGYEFDNKGTIHTGIATAGAAGGAGGSGSAGVSITTSYAGSGGGGGGGGDGYAGGSGGSTLVAGGSGGGASSVGSAGSTPTPPTLTASEVQTLSSNIYAYLSGASGGGGGGTTTGAAGGGGGGGAYGIFIKAPVLIAGTINASGSPGATGGNGGSQDGGGGGGGGGGGVILLVYTTNYTAGTYYYAGGAAGAGGSGSNYAGAAGGAGGNGEVLTYKSTAPIVPSIQYVFQEQQNSNKITLKLNLSVMTMQSISSFSTNPSTCIQYLPCLATAAFTVKPTSWKIVPNGEAVIDTQQNITATTAPFSSAYTAITNFPPAITLTYGQFNPAYSFSLNATNNPTVPTSLTQSPFTFTIANSINANLRDVANFSIFNEQTFNGIANVNMTLLLQGNINAYTFNVTVSNTTTSNGKYFLEIPKSSYINPNITFAMNYSLAPPPSNPLFASSGTFCPTTISATQVASYPLGMVNANGSKYDFYVYTSSGTSASGYIMETQEGKGVGEIQVQSYKIPPQIPFALPLESTGQSYAFDIFSPNCKTEFYSGALSVPTNPIYITLSSLSTAYIYNISRATASCALNSTIKNGNYMIHCIGGDPTQLAYKYELDIYNTTNILGTQQLIRQANFTGSNFNYNTTVPANKNISYSYAVYAYEYSQYDPVFLVAGGPLNSSKIQIAAPLLGFFAFVLFLVLIFGGASTGKITIMLLFTDLGLFAVNILGVLVGSVGTATAIIFISLSLILIFWDRKKGGLF